MLKIFISYRRQDADAITGRIFDRLVGRYGREAVFQDIDNIPAGVDFRRHIAETVRQSNVLLALIGPRWGGRSEKSRRARIMNQDDPVRVEIETALQNNIATIPVLLAATKMPRADQVPDSLADFVFRNALRIDPGRDFEHHVQQLTREIDQLLERHPDPDDLPADAASTPFNVQGVEPASLSLPDKPSIAVLPFQNMSGDPEQEYFVDGMVEEIITALSRIRSLFVIARNSTFTYKSRTVDVKQVGRELGVRYVLEGSVRKAGTRVRITGQLIDALTGMHLWADHFDGALDDIFALQDKVAGSVAAVIEPTLQAAEVCRAARRPTVDLTAYDLYLRALPIYFSFTKAEALRALGLLERAAERDPDYGPALALSARCRVTIDVNAWTEDLPANRQQAIESARHAFRVGEDDPGILVNIADALAYFGEDIDAMLALVERAVGLNPSYAHGWYLSGLIRLWAGQPDRAVEDIETSLRLNPRDRLGVHTLLIGTAHFFTRRFDQAVPVLLLAIHEHPGHATAYRFLASCYAHLGRIEASREIIGRLRVITPALMPTSVEQYRNPDYRELYLSGLRLAIGATA